MGVYYKIISDCVSLLHKSSNNILRDSVMNFVELQSGYIILVGFIRILSWPCILTGKTIEFVVIFLKPTTKVNDCMVDDT